MGLAWLFFVLSTATLPRSCFRQASARSTEIDLPALAKAMLQKDVPSFNMAEILEACLIAQRKVDFVPMPRLELRRAGPASTKSLCVLERPVGKVLAIAEARRLRTSQACAKPDQSE
jgi:hypothetical protein